MRNAFIQVELWRTGLPEGAGFRTYYYGTGLLNRGRPRTVGVGIEHGSALNL